jgi:parvulin-like peptidyl-prolyl isomerase
LPDAVIQAKHQQILELSKRVRAGEDFAALAKQYNEDVISKDTGGEFSFKRDQMEFGDMAFSMKPNQISDVLTNEDGYRIFQLLEIIPAKKTEFAAIADKIKNALIGDEKRRLAPAYLNQLRKEAGVEILDPSLKAAQAAYDAEMEANAQRAAEATNLPPTPPAKP